MAVKVTWDCARVGENISLLKIQKYDVESVIVVVWNITEQYTLNEYLYICIIVNSSKLVLLIYTYICKLSRYLFVNTPFK